ncbi:WbqC family protein [Vibrio toranzoniae]|uniref:WbqC family protein n=1 Tax=Vibrio toranzoniae TaxID=1194427 RepID=UPI00137890E2|nr:WbqC family protein [Vibrio toranzoniae]NAZ95987.1 hypothetical protein [Vibrio toranzoniae]
MKFAVMQPYLFPYLGYYQLVHAVDKFVFYDDVTYIKGGYINRNNILSNDKAQRFTIPVPGMSSNILINKLSFDSNVKKQLRTIEQAYAKAPFFKGVFPIIESVLTNESRNVEHICRLSITKVMDYLNIDKSYYYSSELCYERAVAAAEKLVNISKSLNANEYINSPGGKSLYNKDYFLEHGIKLNFIEIEAHHYNQNSNIFVPHLSMIDVLMWNSKDAIFDLLNKYRLS